MESRQKALSRVAALNGHFASSADAAAAAAPPPGDGGAPSRVAVRGGGDAATDGSPARRALSSYERIHSEVSRAPAQWRAVPSVAGNALTEVRYDKAAGEAIAKVTIARPQCRNAFTPLTIAELSACLTDARNDPAVGVIILTGEGQLAFCSGGDQSVRGRGGYVGEDGVPRLNVLDLQVQIRRLPKPVVAMVAGYAVGGGHILHMVCDLTIAADNAVFGQTGPKVGSFDAGYGSTEMARLVGPKRAKEMWFTARLYDAQQAEAMGLVNKVVPLGELEAETLVWCREMARNSPTALRLTKAAVNAADDGAAGLQVMGGDATMLFYQSEEGDEGRRSYLEKRRPDFSKFKRFP
eukprot:jgi/Tetstr1/428347/TSEL_018382.t1